MQTKGLPIRVLLVEDDEDDFQLIRALLSDISVQRYELEWVADYDAALDALARGPFDVCLLDYRLGERSGHELLKEARLRGCMIPVIFLTGHGDYALDLESMQAGAADYLTKNEISAGMLERSIRYSIRRTQAEDALQKARDRLEERVRERTEELVIANEALRESELFSRSTLDALSAHIAILDEKGFILYTNRSWEVFAKSNGLVDYDFPEVNYLSVCDQSKGNWAEEAPAVAAGIREVISGTRDGFELEYPCHSPDENRWFNMRVTRFKDREPPRVVVAHENITERKQAEETLRKSEERFRELAENIHEVFWVEAPDGMMLYISPAYEEIWGKSRESLYEDPGSFMESIPPEDRGRVLKAYIADHEGKAPFDEEYRILRPDGAVRWIRARSFPIREQGRLVRTVGIAEDITLGKEAEEFLHIERDLALGLGSTGSLTEALELILEACLKIDALDSGGIHLVESETGALRFICHQGLSDGFVEHVSFYEPSSTRAHFVMRGEPGYWTRPEGIHKIGDLYEREGITALAVIPVMAEGKAIAVLNLSSHTQPEIPVPIRSALETIATHIGGIILRVRLAETIKAQGERLREANAALKVLLKQREEDRAELEKSILENVKHLILPYLEKLKKGRLAEDQRLYLDIAESHLEEITSTFVRRVSTRFLGLTPTEIRVSDLIRQGKTSKEIAELLGSSERAIVFHRQSIRGKLGLKKKKVNLQSYLASLSK